MPAGLHHRRTTRGRWPQRVTGTGDEVPPPSTVEVVVSGPGMGGFPVLLAEGADGRIFCGVECGTTHRCDNLSTNNATNLWTATDTGALKRSTAADEVSDTQGLWYDDPDGEYVGSGYMFRGRRGGIERSTDNGETWTTVQTGGAFAEQVCCFARIGTSLFAGMGNWRGMSAAITGKIIRGNTSGSSWTTESAQVTGGQASVVDLYGDASDGLLYILVNRSSGSTCAYRMTNPTTFTAGSGTFVDITGAGADAITGAYGRKFARKVRGTAYIDPDRVYVTTGPGAGDDTEHGDFSSVWRTNNIIIAGANNVVWDDVGPTTAAMAVAGRSLMETHVEQTGGANGDIVWAVNYGTAAVFGGAWRLWDAETFTARQGLATSGNGWVGWECLINGSGGDEGNVTKAWYNGGNVTGRALLIRTDHTGAFTSPLAGGGQMYYSADQLATEHASTISWVQVGCHESPAGTYRATGAMFVSTRGGVWLHPTDADQWFQWGSDWYRYICTYASGAVTLVKGVTGAGDCSSNFNLDPAHMVTLPASYGDRFFIIGGYRTDNNGGLYETTDGGVTFFQRTTVNRRFGGAVWCDALATDSVFYAVQSSESFSETTGCGLHQWNGTTNVERNGDSGTVAGEDWADGSNASGQEMICVDYDVIHDTMYVVFQRSSNRIWGCASWTTAFSSPVWLKVNETGLTGNCDYAPAFKVHQPTGDLYMGTSATGGAVGGWFKRSYSATLSSNAWARIAAGDDADECSGKHIDFDDGASAALVTVFVAGSEQGCAAFQNGVKLGTFATILQAAGFGVFDEGEEIRWNPLDGSVIIGYDCSGNYLIRNWSF